MQMMFLLLHVQLPFCIPKVAGTYTPSLQLPLVLFLMYLPHHTLKTLVEFAPILMIIRFLASQVDAQRQLIAQIIMPGLKP